MQSGAQSDDRIAHKLDASPNWDTGEHSFWQLMLNREGMTFNFAHHIGTTSSAAYESSAPMREMVAGFVEAGQWNKSVPHVIVRSHRHRYVRVTIPSIWGDVECVITPAWQLRTPFVERIDRMRMPHIGGIIFTVEDGLCSTTAKIYPLPEQKPISI